MPESTDVGSDRTAVPALVCSVLAVLASVVAYWLWLPSIVLGAVGVGLGVVTRRRAGPSARDLAVAAIALGVAAILITPGVNVIANSEREYGRDCALNPQGPDC